MQHGRGDDQEARIAVTELVKTPEERPKDETLQDETLQDETPVVEERSQPPQPISADETPQGKRRRIGRMAAISVALLVVVLGVLLADTAQTPGKATVTQHATPTATATPSETPTPAAMLGFHYYTDTADGFQVQYPLDWVNSPANPGTEFADDTKNPGYIVQVLMPSTTTAVGVNEESGASTWVNYELNILAKQWQGNFQQVPGPTQPQTIGGVVWQSGVALLSGNQARIRVQVFATVYQGRPYIINLLAADDRFAAGTIQFFTPMLHSFVFLPPST